MENGLVLAHRQTLGVMGTGGMADLKIVGHRASTDHATMTATVDHHATIMDDLHHRHQKAVEGQTGATAVTYLHLLAKVATHFLHHLAMGQMAAIEDETNLRQETLISPATKVVAETAHEGPASQTIASKDADLATQATRATVTQTSADLIVMTDVPATLEASAAIGETVERDHVVRIAAMTETGATTGVEMMISTGGGRLFIQRTIITPIMECTGGRRSGNGKEVLLMSICSMAGVYGFSMEWTHDTLDTEFFLGLGIAWRQGTCSASVRCRVA